MSDNGPDPKVFATIIGKVETTDDATDAIFEHRMGEGININSRVTLLLEGVHVIETTADELLDTTSKFNGKWDIGERLIFKPDPQLIPQIFSDDIQIKGIITDIETNSMVFWGTLQEGYIEPPQGRGGIWHLDEGIGTIAHDSSNNGNDGYIFGSSWIGGVNNTALGFNSEPADYVVVPNAPGLYITEEITVEAWMKPLDASGGILDNFDFDSKAADINWIHISGDVFAFGYWHPGESTNCRIQTVNLSPSGQIGDTAIDSIDFVGGHNINGFDPDFIHINGSVYAVAHRFDKDNGYVTTLDIYDNGTIGNDIIDRYEFEPDPSNAFHPEIIHISGNIYGIASCEGKTGEPGNIATLEIAANGSITKTVIDRFKFELDDCSFPRLCKIFDNNYVVAYASIDNGYLKTIEIANNGSINKTLIDNFTFDPNMCYETDLEYVAPSIYVIAYRGPGNNGHVSTVEVKNNGNITKDIIDTIIFDPSVYGGQPDIQRVTDANHTFAIAYLGPNDHGYLSTIGIYDNGTILDNIIDTVQFTPHENLEMEPTIVHKSGDVYGIAYKGKAGQGYLITIPIQGNGTIVGTEGIGGIFKDDSYALIVNSTRAFGTINNVTINTTGIVSNDWNHVALTYNGSVICLYINNNENSVKVSYPYNKKINFTDTALYFGYLFYGCLDEIAIYDVALSEADIMHHYLYPGDL